MPYLHAATNKIHRKGAPRHLEIHNLRSYPKGYAVIDNRLPRQRTIVHTTAEQAVDAAIAGFRPWSLLLLNYKDSAGTDSQGRLWRLEPKVPGAYQPPRYCTECGSDIGEWFWRYEYTVLCQSGHILVLTDPTYTQRTGEREVIL